MGETYFQAEPKQDLLYPDNEESNMTNRCPKCGAGWPQALSRPPFPAIACTRCEYEIELRERQEAAHQRRIADLKRESNETVDKFQNMTPEEQAELYAKLDAIWGV